MNKTSKIIKFIDKARAEGFGEEWIETMLDGCDPDKLATFNFEPFKEHIEKKPLSSDEEVFGSLFEPYEEKPKPTNDAEALAELSEYLG